MKNYFILLIAFFIGLQSCETDFEVNAPWKSITIVYGLLNQNESTHIIKINKAFLGESDVNDMAQIQDSSEFAEGEITVKIEGSKNGASPDQIYTLTRFIDTNKAAGTFYAPSQALYRFSDTLLSDHEYKLVITNNSTGKKVEAKTNIIKHFKFVDKSYWTAAAPKVGFFKDNKYTDYGRAKWYSALNGRRYQLTVRFHYTEIDLNTGSSQEKSIDWVFPTAKAQDLNGGDEMENEINGESFYKYIASKLEPVSASNNVQRCAGRGVLSGVHPAGMLDFIVDVGGEDFNTYLEVNEPSTGIVQERPEYTNVFDENGNEQVGFFSARYSIIEEGAVLNRDFIPDNSITELKTGIHTGDYGFVVKTDVSTCPL